VGRSALRGHCSVCSCVPVPVLNAELLTKRTANPASNAEELAYNIGVSGSTTIVAHPDILPIAVAAARHAGLRSDCIVLLGTPEQAAPDFSGFDLHSLITYGLSQGASFKERRLERGEARRKVGFLVFSSGTTGKPKVILLPG
jgi:4-coumarate--CoA ligase